MQCSKLLEVREIGLAAFTSYQGRKFQVESLSGEMTLESYWSGGSRDYWCFVELASLRQTRPVVENGTPFSNGG